MPYDDSRLSPTGLARFQQAAQRPGYISSADRRLIEQGVRTGGGYIELNGQVLVDEPAQYIELSDAGKAYLAWRGTDPKLAGIEAEQAQVRSTQRELMARQVGENNLELLQKEMMRGVMSQEEYQKKQTEILQHFQNSKNPSPIEYLSTAEDQDDPVMQETRYRSNVKSAVKQFIPDASDEMADAISGLTTRTKDGELTNPLLTKVIESAMTQQMEAALTKKEVVKMRLNTLDKQYGSLEEPTDIQTYGYLSRRNQVLVQAGLPLEDLPDTHEVEAGYLWGDAHIAPDSIATTFENEAKRRLSGEQAAQPKKIFDKPTTGGVPHLTTNRQVRAAKVEARKQGIKTIQFIGGDGNTYEISTEL